MRVLVIGNPIAGRGLARRRIAALAAALEQRGHFVDVYLTQQAGDAKRRAGNVQHGYDRIIVVGGDGTLNEVLNGLEDPGRIPLMQLAMGTANILARELRLPRDPVGVAELVEHGVVRRLDMGLLGPRRFLAVISAGFDAQVVRDIHERRRGSLGFKGYVMPVLRTLRSYRPPKLRVTVDGDTVEGAMVVISKIRVYAGFFSICDRARCDSGELDVVVLRRGSFAALAEYGVWALIRRMSRRHDIHYLTGRQVRLEAADRVPIEVDGDYFGPTPIDVHIAPAAVPFVVPQRQAQPV